MAEQRKPLGRPLRWSEEALDRLAEVTPADEEAAAELWRRVAPAPFRDLLDAQPTTEGRDGGR